MTPHAFVDPSQFRKPFKAATFAYELPESCLPVSGSIEEACLGFVAGNLSTCPQPACEYTAFDAEASIMWLDTGLTLKSALLLFQLAGYLASKWIGLKYIPEAIAGNVALHLLGLMLMAELSLVLFAVVPVDYSPIAMLLNGLPLGCVWGLVVHYIEGRDTSDFMLSSLCTAFIVSSGVVKDVALWALDVGVLVCVSR